MGLQWPVAKPEAWDQIVKSEPFLLNGFTMACGKTLGISLSLGGWECDGRCLIGLSTTLIPLESEKP